MIKWSLKIWLNWVRQQNLSVRWILFVVILLPVFATTYQSKETAGISPLQILGFFAFMFSLFYSFTLSISKKQSSNQLVLILFFSILLILNAFLVLVYNFSFSQFGVFIRTILPFFLFFYFRKISISINTIEGFFITFLVSAIFPLSVLSYEVIFEPIKYVYNTESRGGELRLTGLFADLFGYMSYLIGSYTIYGYFLINGLRNRTKKWIFTNFGFIFITLLFLIGVYNLQHQASWVVSIALISILIYYKNKYSSITQILVGLVIVFIVGSFFYSEIFNVLFAKDISVYYGESNEEAALNGRVWIWKKYFEYWLNFNSISQFFGVGFSNHPISSIMMSGGMHSDYVRFMFSTGIVGITFYFLFLFQLIINSFKFKYYDMRFVTHAGIVILLLYSISANPLLASGALMYLLLFIMSFGIKSQIKKA